MKLTHEQGQVGGAALATLALVSWGAKSLIDEAKHGFDDRVIALVAEGGVNEHDFQDTAACSLPQEVRGWKTIRQIMAERCITYGLRDAEFVVVDMTSNDETVESLTQMLPEDIEAVTKGYVTVAPRVIKPPKSFREELKAMKCLPIDNIDTLASTRLVEDDPALQAAPYVLLLTDKDSCGDKMAGVTDGGNSMVVFNTKNQPVEYLSYVAVHETMHLLGVTHDGNMRFAPQNSESKGGDEPFYRFDQTDMTNGVLDITSIVRKGVYEEYDGTCRSVMGTACGYNIPPKLSPLQKHVLHWADRESGESYDSGVRILNDQVTEFLPKNALIEVGLAKLEKPVVIENEKGVEARFTDMQIQALPGYGEDLEDIVDAVIISLANESDARTMQLGILDPRTVETPQWYIDLGGGKLLQIEIRPDGEMSAVIAE